MEPKRTHSLQQLARPYRKSVLSALLLITLAGGIFFTIQNALRGIYPVAIIEFVMAMYSLVILFAIQNTNRLENWILAYLLPFLGTMMFALASPRTSPSVFVWVLIIPLISFLLLGKRLGAFMSIGFMLGAATIFLMKFHNQPDLMNTITIANISIMSSIILVFSFVYEVTREQSETKLLQMAHSDPLTRLANRARLSEAFQHECHRSQRIQSPLALVVFDLDHFKAVNDTYGHEVGDQALIHVANILRKHLRKTDLAARLGGEEFCLLLPDTSLEQAACVAEKIRQAIEQSPLCIENTKIQLTLSGGIAQNARGKEELSDLVRQADKQLYRAKEHGRNQIQFSIPPGLLTT